MTLAPSTGRADCARCPRSAGLTPAAATDVVGLTIAEFIPRQLMRLQRLLAGFPLLGG